LKEAHKSQDTAQIDAAMAEINTAWTAASEDMYKATHGAPTGADAGTSGDGQPKSGGNAENVTDAEFEEVK
jgi:molecular chaperone DnaK